MVDTTGRDTDIYFDQHDQYDDETENYGNREEFNRPTASYQQHGGHAPRQSHGHGPSSSNSSQDRAKQQQQQKQQQRQGRSKGQQRGRKKPNTPPPSSSHESSYSQHTVQPAAPPPPPVVHAVKRQRRLAMFLNGNELFRAQGELGFDFDYDKLFKHLSGEDIVYNAYFYQTYTQEETKVHGFLNALPRVGYTVRKKLTAAVNGSETPASDTLDLDMVADMISTSDLYDRTIICVDDDGTNFIHALEILRNRGKEITILGRQEHVSDEFVNAGDNYMWLEEMKYDIFRPRPGQPTPD